MNPNTIFSDVLEYGKILIIKHLKYLLGLFLMEEPLDVILFRFRNLLYFRIYIPYIYVVFIHPGQGNYMAKMQHISE